MHRRLIWITLLFACSALAGPMYKVVDKYGNVTYTDKPPGDEAKNQSSTPITDKPLNVLEGSSNQNFQKSFEQHAKDRQQQRDEAWNAYDDAVKKAEQRVAAARKAQEQGEPAGEGDFVGVFANGRQTGVRPSDKYLARKKALKQEVLDAEAELNALKRNKPQMSR